MTDQKTPRRIIWGVYLLQMEKNTIMNTNLTNSIQLDWLSFTVENTDENMDRVVKLFGDYGVEKNHFGGMGYDCSATILENGRVYWHSSRQAMGIHVRLNAQSLDLVEMTPIGLLNRVFDWEAKITRIDIAFDDFDGLLDIDEIHRKALAGELVTRWTKVSRVNGSELATGRKIGDTVNLGARSSEAFLRIYDKKLERETKGVDVSDVESWTRVEIELKSGKAQAFGGLLADTARSLDQEPGELCAQLLYGLVDFKDQGTQSDTNKSRWLTSEWWSKFIDTSSKLVLSIAKRAKNLDDAKRWIRRSVASTIGMIVLSKPDDNGVSGFDFIMSCIVVGAENMSDAQKKRLEIYNAQ